MSDAYTSLETSVAPAPEVKLDSKGPLTVEEAAKSLMEWRRKKNSPEGADDATPANGSAPPADAAPPQEPRGEDEGELEPELPLIEAPRSWTKDEKERFYSLPR